MGLLGNIIAKSVITAARNSTIKAAGIATATVIDAAVNTRAAKEDIALKNGTVLIKPTRPKENYIGENAVEIARELLGRGFENVTLKPVEKLAPKAAKKYGRITDISINGNYDFRSNKKIPASSYIVIEYLEFKAGSGPEVYANVEWIGPGVKHSVSDLDPIQTVNYLPARSYMPAQPYMLAQPAAKRFCAYCGQQLQYAEAKYCSACGAKL